MRTPGTRRAALIAGAATVAVVALAGCSAGQVAETAVIQPAVTGVDTQAVNGSVLIRNLQVVYNGTAGYPAGGNAPLELGLFNQTEQQVTVLISSRPPRTTTGTGPQQVVSARQVGLVGGTPTTPSSAAPEPSGSRPAATPITDNSDQVEQPSTAPSTLPTPSAVASAPATTPEARPARITLAPFGSASFLPGDAQTVQALGLSGRLIPGASVNLVFEFSSTPQQLEVPAPVAVPLSPVSRPPVNPSENLEEE
jgi:hypothetical protein